MKKFIIQYKKENIPIMEVECEKLSILDDCVSLNLKDEYRAKILRPISLHQKVDRIVDGKKITVTCPDVWYSHCLFDSIEAAKEKREAVIRYDYEFSFRKNGTSFTEDDVTRSISSLDIIYLS